MKPLFLSGPSGRLFCLLHEPKIGMHVRGALLYLHPFAEEMNKSRRMAALQAAALAARGWFVMQADLFGCGDSDGEFGDASWDGWILDSVFLAESLRERSGIVPNLWGLRAGCLLAAAVAPKLERMPVLLFWQPVTSGKQHLQQFLRTKLASEMLGTSSERSGGTKALQAELLRGNSLEIAGYRLAPELASGMAASMLVPPAQPGTVLWLEMSSATNVDLSPAGKSTIEIWQKAGWTVVAKALTGASFWQTQEIAEVPQLIHVTADLLGQVA